MGIIDINKENYESEVKNFSGTVILDFWAPWGGPCKMLTPIMEGVAQETDENVKVCKINVDENQELAESFNIMNIPFIAIFEAGKLVNTSIGLQNKQTILDLISK